MAHVEGCANFRDIGAWINLIAGCDRLPEQRLYRGGKIEFVRSAAAIGHPGTIINLRKGPDRQTCGAEAYHFPISNDYETYHTYGREVHRWLNRVLQVFEAQGSYRCCRRCLVKGFGR
jgi:protein-tyrosine phosphatase